MAHIGTALYADPVYQLYISIFKIIWNAPVSLMNNVGLPLFAVLTVQLVHRILYSACFRC